MKEVYTLENIKKTLLENGIRLITPVFLNQKQKLLCVDQEGYYIYVVMSNYLTRNGIGRRFDKSNDYSIYNINHFFELNNVKFKCISKNYVSARDFLQFECLRCGKTIKQKWVNINRNDSNNRSHLLCDNCDGRTESLHALILKQMFSHYYPDTILEDKSFRNIKTNKICPTDIVNHRLKIAIEIQSQWHDFKDHKYIDIAKKQFWINKGYSFFDPDIRDYSILEMCQLFFNIEELPSFINYDFSNKINIKQIQSMLNKGYTIVEISNLININSHRIYDAVYSGKLYYPENYPNRIKKQYT